MILFINACVRKESRTKELADYVLSKRKEPYEEVSLNAIDFPLVDEDFLKRRDRLIAHRAFGDPVFDLARQFAEADEIVIAAPFWDLSFPAALKQYLEQINVCGITFFYTPEGIPTGLCRANRLSYITTVGGEFFPEEYGAGYLKALAQNFYGIPEFRLIKATGLDLIGANIEAILDSAKKSIEADWQVRDYEGAKAMLLVDEVDDRAFLKELLEAMYPELPAAKKRK